MRIVFFVEGETEKKVLPVFLRKWFQDKTKNNVGIRVVRFNGWPDLINKAPKKAEMYLNNPQHKNEIIAVIALLDLYGPDIYPDKISDAEKRYTWGKKHLEDKVDEEKFFQFFCVHEIEAWLLSDPKIFPSECQNRIDKLSANPEEINFDDPPSKRLNRIYLKETGKAYRKLVDGYHLFNNLDPNIAYNKCPRLKEMLDFLLTLAEKAS